ncbi:hypothetical protein K470DRAFT_98597 [Piedraia hortae CBS 480.64]|uniref:F-box domain-containing protein n=1 Tax=Piedraia hortae CBS 480.64 TaxID=1314780 RepID=A0A6A7BXT9_9PEZI|nr:hypothetical protein K470DRAFT_98597 [Piedraia hortae CBS 480.64]
MYRRRKKLSLFEHTLCMPETYDQTQQIRHRLLPYLGAVDLRTLRGVSWPLQHLVKLRACEMFGRVHINFPVAHPETLWTLRTAAGCCRELTMTFSGTPAGQAALPSPTSIYSQDRRRSTSNIDRAQRGVWVAMLEQFEQLESLIIQVQGDAGWLGFGECENTLITIRSALDESSLPKLETLRVDAVTAMGVLALRWDGFSAFGPPALHNMRVPCIWQRITYLTLHVRNPQSSLTESQKHTFFVSLRGYLASFAPTILSLSFVWLDRPGPTPLALPDTSRIQWPRLKTLKLGNTLQLQTTMTAVSETCPRLDELLMPPTALRPHHDPLDTSYWFSLPLDDLRSRPASLRSLETSNDSDGAVVPFVLDMGDGHEAH